MAYGARMSVEGIFIIIGSIANGAAVTIGSGGTMLVGGVAVSVKGIAVGSATLALGGSIALSAAGNYGSDINALNNIKNNPYYKSGRPSGGNPTEDVLVRKTKADIKSEDFKDFLRANEENPNKWTKIMETWETPDGVRYERHYWTNGTKSYYHD